MKFVISLIGYLCVASVCTASLGFGYLWNSGRLDNEKMVRILAIIHDVNLEEIGKEDDLKINDIPGTELSLSEIERQKQLIARDFEVKQVNIIRSIQEFDIKGRELSLLTEKYDQLAKEMSELVEQEDEKINIQAVNKVVMQIEGLEAEMAKKMILDRLDQNGVDAVIPILDRMNDTKRKEILNTMTLEELEKLKLIQDRILEGYPAKEKLDDIRKQLEANK